LTETGCVGFGGIDRGAQFVQQFALGPGIEHVAAQPVGIGLEADAIAQRGIGIAQTVEQVERQRLARAGVLDGEAGAFQCRERFDGLSCGRACGLRRARH
jgi:hypothetical protein